MGKDNNNECPPRQPPDFDIEIGEDVVKDIAKRSRIAPLYETGMADYVITKHFSLARNANLACAWEKYKQTIDSRIQAPFQFPEHRDIHFYNYALRFMPSKSEYKRVNFRRTLRPGPGVDDLGQMPIPQESLMRRGGPSNEKKARDKKGKSKEKKDDKDEKAAKEDQQSDKISEKDDRTD